MMMSDLRLSEYLYRQTGAYNGLVRKIGALFTNIDTSQLPHLPLWRIPHTMGSISWFEIDMTGTILKDHRKCDTVLFYPNHDMDCDDEGNIVADELFNYDDMDCDSEYKKVIELILLLLNPTLPEGIYDYLIEFGNDLRTDIAMEHDYDFANRIINHAGDMSFMRIGKVLSKFMNERIDILRFPVSHEQTEEANLIYSNVCFGKNCRSDYDHMVYKGEEYFGHDINFRYGCVSEYLLYDAWEYLEEHYGKVLGHIVLAVLRYGNNAEITKILREHFSGPFYEKNNRYLRELIKNPITDKKLPLIGNLTIGKWCIYMCCLKYSPDELLAMVKTIRNSEELLDMANFIDIIRMRGDIKVELIPEDGNNIIKLVSENISHNIGTESEIFGCSRNHNDLGKYIRLTKNIDFGINENTYEYVQLSPQLIKSINIAKFGDYTIFRKYLWLLELNGIMLNHIFPKDVVIIILTHYVLM